MGLTSRYMGTIYCKKNKTLLSRNRSNLTLHIGWLISDFLHQKRLKCEAGLGVKGS